jgi:hypothetical protein
MGAGVDTWEDFFSEKSRRRAAAVSLRTVLTWSLLAAGFLAFVVWLLVMLGL